jgi:hypothetical protein
MPEPVNAAIEKALADKAIAFAENQSPVLQISLQNGIGANGKHFTPPKPAKETQWLRATVLPAPALTTGLSYTAHVHHYGLLQIDVIQGKGGGVLAMARTVAAIRAFFPMGLAMTQDDFVVRVSPLPGSLRVVSQGPLMNDSDVWVKIPVSIPWICFEQPA